MTQPTRMKARSAEGAEAMILARGLTHLQRGQLDQAESAFRALLDEQPDHPDALHGLALVAYQAQNHDWAYRLASQAVSRSRKRVAGYYRTLGRACRALGKPDEAIRAYRAALAIEPALADVHVSIGIVLREQGEVRAAIGAYRKALSQQPALFEAYVNLENAVREAGAWDDHRRWLESHAAGAAEFAEPQFFLGKLALSEGRRDAALKHLRNALQHNPSFADAQRLLEAAEGDLAHPVEAAVAHSAAALATHERAVALQPESAQAHYNLGMGRKTAGDLGGAIAALRKAVELHADYFDARLNLSRLLREAGHVQDAVAQSAYAVDLRSESAEAHCVHAEALSMAGATAAALEEIERALALRPEAPEVYLNLGNLLTQHFQVERAIEAYRDAIVRAPDVFIARSNYVFVLNYAETMDAEGLFREHRDFDARHCAGLTAMRHESPGAAAAERPIRVGFLSADLRSHSVANFIEPLFRHHDRTRYSFHCYFNQLVNDAVSDRLENLVAGWTRCAAMSDDALTRRIRDDDIDVLIELSGHTAGHRLLTVARRPAPLQMTFLGYPTTTGLSEIDYRLTDAYVDPPGWERFNSEVPARLPNSYFCYGGGKEVPVGPLPALSRGTVTFGCFNNLAKMSGTTLDLWAQVLLRVPGSKLLVKSFGLQDNAAGNHLKALMASRGVSEGRIEVMPWEATGESHFQRYNQVDVALDTYPYNGATTTCEALWMGVPVVTLVGERHAARMGLSILAAAGLERFAARTPEDYVEKAVQTASDVSALAALRIGLRSRILASPLMDAPGYTTAFQSLVRDAWRTWCGV